MKIKDEAGQAAALTAVFMTVLLGSCAAVLDVGAWFREDRDTQRVVDAAVLAGAQALPDDPSKARALALHYSKENGEELPAANVTISTTVVADDTIRAELERPAPGFFAKLFGIDSVTVGSTATARAGVPAAAKYVAPVVVNEKHEKIVCACYGDKHITKIVLENQHKPGSGDAAGTFGLLNLDAHSTGAPGASTIGGWMQKGFDELMEPGVFRSAPSALFNSSEMDDALDIRTGTIVLFPVCKATGAGNACKIDKGGQNAEYEIVGWVAFYITGYQTHGSSGWVEGYFTDAVWQGKLEPSQSTPDFGVRTISLID
jgi:Flp pilus assembly protein TadG